MKYFLKIQWNKIEIVSFELFNNNNSLYFSSLLNSNLKIIETNDYVYTNEI